MNSEITRIFIILLLLAARLSAAGDIDLERRLQRGPSVEKTVVKKAGEKHKKGEKADKETAHLKARAKDIKAEYLQLLDKFKMREEELKSLGGIHEIDGRG